MCGLKILDLHCSGRVFKFLCEFFVRLLLPSRCSTHAFLICLYCTFPERSMVGLPSGGWKPQWPREGGARVYRAPKWVSLRARLAQSLGSSASITNTSQEKHSLLYSFLFGAVTNYYTLNDLTQIFLSYSSGGWKSKAHFTGLKSRCRQDWFPPEALGQNLCPRFFHF